VIGIHRDRGVDTSFIQLVGDGITAEGLLEALAEAATLYTYNGSRFDLPFIRALLGVDLADHVTHHDLMRDCWRNNLYGGLKSVERQLGIGRRLREVNGYEAVRLWWRYVNDYDEDALATLLEYNREDVLNLKALKGMLVQPPVGSTPQNTI
jgi:uncharacterized protein YprB with RNaseH-like and TPR domain